MKKKSTIEWYFRIPKIVIFLVLTLTLVGTLRSLVGTDFFRPHDFTHAARIMEMERSIVAGEFPVRWSQNFGFGYGMPLFNFYAPLPYYIAQVPLVLGFDAIGSIKFLYIVNGFVAFIAMYLFGKVFWGRLGGILCAVFFSFATYRALDLFVRGAIGEVFAMALIPLALYGACLIGLKKKYGVIISGIALAMILLSHNLTGMISLPVFFLFGVLYSIFCQPDKKIFGKKIVLLLAAVGLGIALSSFYTLPAFFEKQYTRVEETITTGDFDFHNHFVAKRQLVVGTWGYGGSIPGLEDGISFALGYVPIIVLGVAAIALLARGSLQLRKQGILLFIFFVGLTFFTLSNSAWLWEHLPLLKFMQFPWRFLAFSHVFLAMCTGAILVGIRQENSRIAVVCIAALLVVSTQVQYFWPERLYSSNELHKFYSTDPAWIASTLSETLNDYIPPEIKGANYPAPPKARQSIVTGNGTIDIVQDKPSQMRSQIDCQGSCTVLFSVFRFPGWKVWVDGKSANLENYDLLPLYTTALSSGTHQVRIQLTDTPIREIGNILSLISVGTIVILYAKNIYTRRS